MERKTNPFDEALLAELAAAEEEKRAAGIAPAHTLRRELARRIDASLNRLYAAGRIKVGDTVNDKYIITQL